jgi:hypothetical protein
MPKVVLEIEITSTGEAKLATVSGALGGIEQAAKSTADAQNSLRTSGEQLADGQGRLGATGAALRDELKGIGQQGLGLMGTFGGLVRTLGPAGLALGAAGYAAHSAITEFTALATQVRDLSYLSGGSAREVSILVTGLEDLGVSSDAVQQSLAFMSNAIENGSPALLRLGVASRNADGSLKTGLQTFYETVDALSGVKNELERNSLAREIFGRGWTQMIPIIEQGAGKIRELGEENAKAGKIMDEAGIQKAREFNLALKDLGNAWEGLKISVGGGIIAPVTLLARWIGEIPNLLNPASGMSVDAAERARILEQIDPTGRLRGQLPAGSMASDVGAWRMGGGGARVTGSTGQIDTRKTVGELQRDLLAAQMNAQQAALGALRADTQPEGAAKIEAELDATEKLLRAKQGVTLAEIAMAERENKLTPSEAARKRELADAERLALLAKARLEADNRRRAISDAAIKQESAGHIAAIEEQERNDIQAAQDEAKRLEEHWKLVEKVQQAEIAGWVSVAEESMDADWAAALTKVRIYEDMSRLRESHLSGQFAALDREAEAVRAAERMDILSAEEAATAIVDIETRRWKAIDTMRDKETQRHKDLMLQQLAATDDYFAKMTLGLEYALRDWRTTDQTILDITKEFAIAATRSLDELYFNVLTGRFENLTDVVRRFGEALLRIGTQELARATLSYLSGGSGGFLSGLGAGATASGARGESSASGGSGSAILSGIPILGLADKLTGGALSAGAVSAWDAITGGGAAAGSLAGGGAAAGSLAGASASAGGLYTSGAAAGLATTELSAAAGSLAGGGAAAGSLAGAAASAGGLYTSGAAAGLATTELSATVSAMPAMGPAAAVMLPVILGLANMSYQQSVAPAERLSDRSASANRQIANYRRYSGMSMPQLIAAAQTDADASQALAWYAYNTSLGLSPEFDYSHDTTPDRYPSGNLTMWLSGIPASLHTWLIDRIAATGAVPDYWSSIYPEMLRTGVAYSYANERSDPYESRALGGPVEAGRAYLIHPPEVYTVDAPGRITSQADTRAMLAGGGSATLTLNIDARGSLADPRALADLVREKIRPLLAELDRLRSGPGYARG